MAAFFNIALKIQSSKKCTASSESAKKKKKLLEDRVKILVDCKTQRDLSAGDYPNQLGVKQYSTPSAHVLKVPHLTSVFPQNPGTQTFCGLTYISLICPSRLRG